jgi:hypothetical protein
MSMEYAFKAADGSEGKMSSALLQEYMQSAGIQSTISPDGMTAKVIMNGQEFEGPVKDLVEQYYGKVDNILPSTDATDYSTLDNTLKAGIAQFSSDNLKAKYLQIAMENAGIQDAKIVGSGDDWFRYEPSTGTYMALTNKPGAELSDVLTYAPQAARSIGSILGSAPGTLAALSGVGAVPGVAAAMVGSTIGGQVGKRGAAAFQQLLDPNFDAMLNNMSSEELAQYWGNEGTEAVTDALTGAVPFGLGKVGKEIFAKGAATRVGGWGARGVEAGAKAGQQFAKLGANSELVRGLTTAVAVPPIGAMQGIGFLMQAPQWAATKGMGYLGRGLEKMGYGNAGGMLQRASSKGRGALDAVEEFTKNYSNYFIPDDVAARSLRPQARDSLGNLAEEIGENLYTKGMNNLNTIQDPIQRAAEFTRLQNQRYNLPRMGETAGRIADSSATIGRGLEQTADQGSKLLFQGADKALGATSGVARGVRTGMDILAPLEARSALQYGKMRAEENLPWRRQ